jgi:hypothetical protein
MIETPEQTQATTVSVDALQAAREQAQKESDATRPLIFRTPPPMPTSIAVAILKVQRQITSLVKEHENKFASFNYTSVDQIYELVGVKMAEAGLLILPTELSPTIIKAVETKHGKKQWGSFHIGYIFVAENGDTWTDPTVCETLFIQIEGSTTYHAAKSFAQKTFLRGLFKIPTGEADLAADEGKDDATPDKVAPKKAKKLSREDSHTKAKEIVAELKEQKVPLTPEYKDAFGEKWNTVLDTMEEPHVKIVKDKFIELSKPKAVA